MLYYIKQKFEFPAKSMLTSNIFHVIHYHVVFRIITCLNSGLNDPLICLQENSGIFRKTQVYGYFSDQWVDVKVHKKKPALISDSPLTISVFEEYHDQKSQG